MNIPFEDGLYNIQAISGHLGHVGFTTRHPGVYPVSWPSQTAAFHKTRTLPFQ